MNIDNKQKMVSLLYHLAMSDGVYQPQEKKFIDDFISKNSLPIFKLEPNFLPELVLDFTSMEKRAISEELNKLMRADGIITAEETQFFAKVTQFLN